MYTGCVDAVMWTLKFSGEIRVLDVAHFVYKVSNFCLFSFVIATHVSSALCQILPLDSPLSFSSFTVDRNFSFGSFACSTIFDGGAVSSKDAEASTALRSFAGDWDSSLLMNADSLLEYTLPIV